MADYQGDITKYIPNPVNIEIPIQVIRGKIEDEAKKALQKYIKTPQATTTNSDTSGNL